MSIQVNNLSKHFRFFKREAGLKGAFKSFFNRKYENFHALKGISFDLDDGEILGVLGENGAGKSTLIKCLTGEVQPTTGTVWQHPNARIGYIAQHAFHHIEQYASRRPKSKNEAPTAFSDGDESRRRRATASRPSHAHRHMDKTPNEYIRWRYAGGEDREAIAKDTMKISDAELELQKTVH